MWTAIRSIFSSIRLHKVVGNNEVGIESLVDETLLLQPVYLAADILDVELAGRVDIGAVADHLLDRQVGIFSDDLQERLGLVVDRRLAMRDRGQDHIAVSYTHLTLPTNREV